MWTKALPYILMILAVLSILGAVYWYGRDDGKNKAENVQLKAVVESVKEHELKTKEIVTLPDAALRERYCKWVRDSQERCMSADIPIR